MLSRPYPSAMGRTRQRCSPTVRHLLIGLLWLGSWPSPGLRAEPAAGAATAPAPATDPAKDAPTPATAIPAPEPLQLKEGWIASQQLLQLPDWLTLGVSFTAEPAANPIGGTTQQAAWIGQTVIALSAGRGLARPPGSWSELDHWSLNTSLTHNSGNDLYSADIGALFPLQQAAYPKGFLLSEVSLNRSSGDGWLGIKAGIVPLNPSFIAAPVFDLYVHSAFNNTLNININGLPISPYAALGGIVTVQPNPALTLSYGWFDLNTTQPLAEWLGSLAPWVETPSGTAQMLQVNWAPVGWSPATGTPVSACRTAAGVVRRRPGCRHPVAVQNRLPAALLSFGGYQNGSESNGLYGSATLRSGLPIGLDERVWIGGAWTADTSTTITPNFLAAGLVVQGPLPSRPLDLLVLGAGRAGLNPTAIGSWPSRHEAMVELGYQFQLNANLNLQPTLQWILNPSAAPQPVPSILAAILQLSLSF